MASKNNLIFKFLKNKSGFSLVEILAALGITTILALSLASTMGFLGMHKKSIELSQEANELVDDFRATVQKGTACETMLTGKNIDTSGAPVAVSLDVFNRGSTKTFTAGTQIVKGITVAGLDLMVDMNTPYKDTVVDEGGTMKTMRQYPTMIRLQFQKVGTFNPKPVFIPLKVYTETSSTVIRKCVAQEMRDANDCVSIGYKWDYAAGKCLPTGRCLYGGSYSNSPQGAFVNPLTGGYSCPAVGGYTAYQSGAINYSSDCGKSCVQANVVPVMSCLRCVDATGADRSLSANSTGTVSNNIDYSADLDSDSQQMQDQFNQIMANLTRDASQPDFVCKPSGTLLTGSTPDCTGGTLGTQAQPPPSYCCSGNVNVCTDTYNLGNIYAGSYTVMRYMECQ